MTITAFSLLAQDMKLTDIEQRVVVALLDATPIAITGKETMMPIADLCAALDLPFQRLGRSGRLQSAQKAAELLMVMAHKTRTINIATVPGEEQWVGFSLIQEVNFSHNSSFLHYTLNLAFITTMKQLKAARNLKEMF